MQTTVSYLRRSKYENTVDTDVDKIELSYFPDKIGVLNRDICGFLHFMAGHSANPITGGDSHRGASGHQSAKAKLADILLMVAQRNYGEDSNALKVLISLRDIADYLGLTINKVCYELQTMDRQGAISVGKSNEIVLINYVALQEIATTSKRTVKAA